jgi:hypothetical protein
VHGDHWLPPARTFEFDLGEDLGEIRDRDVFTSKMRMPLLLLV